MKLIYLLLATCLICVSKTPAQENGVSVQVMLEQEQFLPSEDVIVSVRIVNNSGQTLEFGKGDNWLTFSVEAKNNYIVSKLGDAPVAGEFSLESSLAGTRHVNLTPYFNFKQPGHYQIIANVKIRQWDKEIASKPKSFDIIHGTSLKEIEFGRPLATGETNALPEVRKYILQQATSLKQMKLYVRLTDSTGAITYKVFPIASLVSFSRPEAQLDKYSNLHVLNQTGARAFSYSIINPDAQILTRQTYDYTASRPRLIAEEEGKIRVAGGIRRVTAKDLPPPEIEAAKIEVPTTISEIQDSTNAVKTPKL